MRLNKPLCHPSVNCNLPPPHPGSSSPHPSHCSFGVHNNQVRPFAYLNHLQVDIAYSASLRTFAILSLVKLHSSPLTVFLSHTSRDFILFFFCFLLYFSLFFCLHIRPSFRSFNISPSYLFSIFPLFMIRGLILCSS